MTTTNPEVLNNGHFVVLRYLGDINRRGVNGLLLDPPRLLFVWYDIEHDCPRQEYVTFEMAKVIAPEKYEQAMKHLKASRERA